MGVVACVEAPHVGSSAYRPRHDSEGLLPTCISMRCEVKKTKLDMANVKY